MGAVREEGGAAEAAVTAVEWGCVRATMDHSTVCLHGIKCVAARDAGGEVISSVRYACRVAD